MSIDARNQFFLVNFATIFFKSCVQVEIFFNAENLIVVTSDSLIVNSNYNLFYVDAFPWNSKT